MNTSPSVDLCVVGGAGHVGLPLALVFADKGLDVLIYDVNEETLRTIGRGVLPFMELGGEPILKKVLENGRLTLSSNRADVAKAKTVVITIGTPVDEFHNPVLQVIRDCVNDLLPHLSDKQLLILRSTVYPGTTEWLDRYLKSCGLQGKLAFCPERVVQGLAIDEIREVPQIISGTTPEAQQMAVEFFKLISSDLVILSPMEAEFAKLMCNAYRYIQFAVANQFHMIAESAGVDYGRVLAGIKKDYPRARDIPSAGFAAGPCLFKDTMQLAAFANNQFTLGHAAMLVNEGLVLHLVEEIDKKRRLEDTIVGLLGMAFKADIDDTRASLSYKLKKMLDFRAKATLTTDPHVTTDPDLLPLDEVVEKSDLLILCVPHSAYKGIDLKGKPLVDIWGYLGERTEI